jgi:hypothetical protein
MVECSACSIGAGRSPASRSSRASAFSAAADAAANGRSVQAFRRKADTRGLGFRRLWRLPGRLDGGDIMKSTMDAAPAFAGAVTHTTGDEADARPRLRPAVRAASA